MKCLECDNQIGDNSQEFDCLLMESYKNPENGGKVVKNIVDAQKWTIGFCESCIGKDSSYIKNLLEANTKRKNMIQLLLTIAAVALIYTLFNQNALMAISIFAFPVLVAYYVKIIVERRRLLSGKLEKKEFQNIIKEKIKNIITSKERGSEEYSEIPLPKDPVTDIKENPPGNDYKTFYKIGKLKEPPLDFQQVTYTSKNTTKEFIDEHITDEMYRLLRLNCHKDMPTFTDSGESDILEKLTISGKDYTITIAYGGDKGASVNHTRNRRLFAYFRNLSTDS